tara:strand:+ start:29 stop:262 length:234 start_codon:yes stop_codon:yes gene_type:complete
MTTGFVLIVTQTGFEHVVREELDKINEVKERWGLFGEFDILVKIEAEDNVALTTLIVSKIRPIQGIRETRTLIGALI